MPQIPSLHRTHCMRWCLLALTVSLSACSSLLPRTHSDSQTFQNFEEARKAIESLEPSRSDVKTLAKLGIEPAKQPNLLILTYADIVHRVLNGSVLTKDDLNPGIVQCISARDACRGWEFSVSSITKARTGNFFTDFFNFTRRTETTGWRFNALILMVNDVVVYRTWGGQPTVNELEVHSNPLGPLQDVGPSLVPPPK